MTVTLKGIQVNMPAEPVHQRFSAFHLDVAIFSDRLSWVISKLDSESTERSVLELLHADLERLLDGQNCRPDLCQESASTEPRERLSVRAE